MSVPVISAAVAQQLNQKVQRDIDPHLFLFCNYEPTVSYAISEDGAFFTAIQDLYKFGIDSCCILKEYSDYIPKQEWWQFRRLRDLLDVVSMLRAVTDHNQSIQNGKIEQTQLDAYETWIESALNKSIPETQQDFSVLNQTLGSVAMELVQLIEKFIQCIANNPGKAAVVQKWTDRTVQWYSNNTKTEIYKGQLMNAYVANANAAGNNHQELYDLRSLRRKTGKWIKAALSHPYDKELRELGESISAKENMLNGSNAVFRALKAKMTAEQLQEFEAKLREDLMKDRARRAAAEREQGELEARIGGKYIDFFFRNLENQLRNTIKKLDSSGQDYTLLPQDLIQEDIEYFFGGVPSPEADF